jgi:hypothetical protein
MASRFSEFVFRLTGLSKHPIFPRPTYESWIIITQLACFKYFQDVDQPWYHINVCKCRPKPYFSHVQVSSYLFVILDGYLFIIAGQSFEFYHPGVVLSYTHNVGQLLHTPSVELSGNPFYSWTSSSFAGKFTPLARAPDGTFNNEY